MATSMIVAPIDEDRLADWRAFLDELTLGRRMAWAESQRRRGITREVVFLWFGDGGPAAVYLIEGVEAGAALEALQASSDEFDRWYQERLHELHGAFDVPERLFDTRPPPGSWRGWRGRLRRGGIR